MEPTDWHYCSFFSQTQDPHKHRTHTNTVRQGSIGDRRSQWPLARGWLRRGWRIVLSGRKEVENSEVVAIVAGDQGRPRQRGRGQGWGALAGARKEEAWASEVGATSKLQCWTSYAKQLARQEHNPIHWQRGCLKS